MRQVVADLATRLMARDCVDVNELHRVLTDDGFAVFEGDVSAVRAADQPADRLAQYVEDFFESRSALSVAANHYAQATRAFDREDWEAANAQFRSSFDATFDALANAHGAQARRAVAAPALGYNAKGSLRRMPPSSSSPSQALQGGTALTPASQPQPTLNYEGISRQP